MTDLEIVLNHLDGLAKRAGKLKDFSTPAQRLDYIATVRKTMDIMAPRISDQELQRTIAFIRSECDKQEALAKL